MELFLGIDLGSTTSKAVLVDADANVVGQGLTNTRSNYDVAAKVARAEAVWDAELSRMEKRLEAAGVADARALSQRINEACRLQGARDRLVTLKARAVELVAEAPDTTKAAVKRTEAIFEGMQADVETLFRPLATDRSRFFRDLASGRFLADAEAASEARELTYDLAVGAWDRAIIDVENGELDDDVEARFTRAVDGMDLKPELKAKVLAVREALKADPIVIHTMVGTGYGRQRLPFPKECIRSEILCHGLGAHAMFGGTRTVLDIGGQDTKAIQVGADGVVTSFQMNDRCAAGCGRYLGYIAEEMNLGIHELGPLALQAVRAVKISSTCTVFAGVELRERLSLGEKRENILLGLHRAIVMRAMSLLARSGGVTEQLTFTGGVAKNPAVVQELHTLVQKHYGITHINIDPDSIFTGALGAAIFAQRQQAQEKAA